MLGVHRRPEALSCARRQARPAINRASNRSSRSRATCIARSGPSDVIVLDFDGVLLDSEGEITKSAFVAAKQRWPQLFDGVSVEQEEAVARKMRKVRPVLVRGYESMIMVRMLMEDLAHVDLILSDWETVLHAKTQQYNESASELTALYESIRNAWMTGDPVSWMAQQQPYQGVADALRACPYPVYLATSKAGHRVSALMRAALGVDLPPDSPHLFAALLPPEAAKAAALRTISQLPQHTGATLHFVDDRLDTLKAVAEQPDLSHIRLYLASWGYNTRQEREEAGRTKGVKIIDLGQFDELMRFGLVMGVSDGCEPSAEEVAQGVASPRKHDEE